MKINDIKKQIRTIAMRSQNPAATRSTPMQVVARATPKSGAPTDDCFVVTDTTGSSKSGYWLCCEMEVDGEDSVVCVPVVIKMPEPADPATHEILVRGIKLNVVPIQPPRVLPKKPKPKTVTAAPVLVPQFNPGEPPAENRGGRGHGHRHGGGGAYALYPSYAYPFSYYPYAPYAYTTFGYPYVYPYAPWNYYWSWYYPYWGGGVGGKILGGAGGGQPLLSGGGGFGGGGGMGGLAAAAKNPSNYRIVGEPYMKGGKRHVKVQDTHTGEVHEIQAAA